MNNLGYYYDNQNNYNEAIKWYKKADKAGSANASSNLKVLKQEIEEKIRYGHLNREDIQY